MNLLAPILACAPAATLLGQAASGALLSHSFDNDAEGWVAMRSNATAHVTTQAGSAKRGSGALTVKDVRRLPKGATRMLVEYPYGEGPEEE